MRDTYQFYDNAMITAGLNDAESSKYLKKLCKTQHNDFKKIKKPI